MKHLLILPLLLALLISCGPKPTMKEQAEQSREKATKQEEGEEKKDAKYPRVEPKKERSAADKAGDLLWILSN